MKLTFEESKKKPGKVVPSFKGQAQKHVLLISQQTGIFILCVSEGFWGQPPSQISLVRKQPCWLFTLIDLCTAALLQKYYLTENGLSSRCLTFMIIQELGFPSLMAIKRCCQNIFIL